MQKVKRIEHLLIDDFVRNSPTTNFVVQNDNDYFKVSFIKKPLSNDNIFKRIKHSVNVLRGVATPVYFFEDIRKYYPDKEHNYIDFKKNV